MGKKKTHEEYVVQVAEFNSNIEVVGRYINSDTKILHRCKKHDVEWMITPSHVLQGCECVKCKGEKIHNKKAKDISLYKEELKENNKDVVVVGDYINARTPILHKCTKCGNTWYVAPDNLLRGYGCPACALTRRIEIRTKTHEQFIQELLIVNPLVKMLEEYNGARNKILCKCLVDNCGYEWYTTPDSLLSGHGCPACTKSNGEKRVQGHLELRNIKFIPQYTFSDCKNIKMLPFDFYLPDYNACIEYDGIQHFEAVEFFGGESAFEDRVKLDFIKTNYCLANNIPLLRIRYDEDIVEALDSFLNNTKLLNEVV